MHSDLFVGQHGPQHLHQSQKRTAELPRWHTLRGRGPLQERTMRWVVSGRPGQGLGGQAQERGDWHLLRCGWTDPACDNLLSGQPLPSTSTPQANAAAGRGSIRCLAGANASATKHTSRDGAELWRLSRPRYGASAAVSGAVLWRSTSWGLCTICMISPLFSCFAFQLLSIGDIYSFFSHCTVNRSGVNNFGHYYCIG